jgi:hypothetical protein
MPALVHVLMFMVLGASTLVPYFASIGAAPGILKYLPELFSAAAALVVLAGGMRQRFAGVSPKYWLVFAAMVLVMVCGALANDEGSGPVINGVRIYVRAMPFFLLPMVYDFKDWQLRQYLRLLMVICLVQVPVAVFQRYNIMATGHTSAADDVQGTLMASGVLSYVLTCALCLLAAAVARGRASLITFGLSFLLFMIPMSINETKVTPIILPLGLLITFIYGARPARRVQATVAALVTLIIGAAIFIPVFDYYQAKSDVPYKIEDFFSKKQELSEYLDADARVGSGKDPGRVDAILIPLQQMSRDPVTLFMGVGMGNASRSSISPSFIGKYNGMYELYTQTSASSFLIELGVLGLGLVLLLHWLIFRDTLFVARNDEGLVGTLALGFVAVVVIMTLGLSYIGIHASEALSYLFWFFAGVIVARRRSLSMARADVPSGQELPSRAGTADRLGPDLGMARRS